MKWLLMLLPLACVACNSNNNGTHDVKNGSEITANLDNVDPHEMRPGVFYCVRMTGPDWHREPCWRQLANCERERAAALSNTYDADKCERKKAVFCYEWRPDNMAEWSLDCRGTRDTCLATRKRNLSRGNEVTDCKRPEAQRRGGPRQWRVANRVDQ